MKTAICAFGIISFLCTVHAQEKEVFRFSNLEGFEVTHTEFGKRPSEGSGFLMLPDKIAGEITISLEKKAQDEDHPPFLSS